jgi:tetratricopeptide (TPR) repeat protein
MTEGALSTTSSLAERSGALRRTARMLACQRRFEQARDHYREGVALIRDAGMLRETAGSDMGKAFIEQRAGDLEAAESALREGAEQLAAIGDTGFYSGTLCMLAEILALRGADDEALSLCKRAREVMSPSDLDPVTHTDAIEGLLVARRGDHAEGERLARRALETLAEADSDFYEQLGGYRLLLAQTLLACGKRDEARKAADEALAVFEAKGDEPAADWARELLASLD